MTVPSIPFVFSCDQALQRWINIPFCRLPLGFVCRFGCLINPFQVFPLTTAHASLTPGNYYVPAHPWHPRTAPRPTDQISGELKEPTLSAWLGIDPYIDPIMDETQDIPFAPVPPSPASNTTDTKPTDPSP
jgi:hypothetical protein